jgi:hypothetical protein
MSRPEPIPTRPGWRMLSGLAAAALLAAWIVLPTTGAHAGIGADYDVDVNVVLTESDEALEFTYEYTVSVTDGEVECETDIAIYVPPDTEGEPPEALDTTIIVNETDDTSGTFILPDLEGGGYDLLVVVATCTVFDDGVEIGESQHGDFVEAAFARLLIDKEVEGDVPAGTTFTVEVACEEGEGVAVADVGPQDEHDGQTAVYERQFGADGGSDVVYFYGPADCIITETEDGGAESTSIEPDEVEISDPEDFSTVVTNTFPEAEEEEEPVEEEEEEEEIEEAEPAEPVEEEPDYTG